MTRHFAHLRHLAFAGVLAAAGFYVVSTATGLDGQARALSGASVAGSTRIDLNAPAIRRSVANTVKVVVQFCRGHHAGSGFAISSNQIVTNAHVVVGAQAINVFTADGRFAPASVMLFDPARDLSVLSVHGLPLQPLRLSRATAGQAALAIGYPMNGSERLSSGTLERYLSLQVPDIYGQPSGGRHVLEMRADLEAGNSGGPVVNADGAVVGVVFAASIDSPGVDFALSSDEIASDLRLAAGQTGAVSAGPCI